MIVSSNPIYAGNSTQLDVIDLDAEWEDLTTGAVVHTSRDAQSVVEKFGKGENELVCSTRVSYTSLTFIGTNDYG